MDAVIEYDEAGGFLKNPPSLEPCLNFINIHALQKHIVQGLAWLACPQSAIHGWPGLAMDPAAYLLLEGVAFNVPPDPGPTVIFPGGMAIAQTVTKTTQATFDCAKNYFLSYKNISRACWMPTSWHNSRSQTMLRSQGGIQQCPSSRFLPNCRDCTVSLT
jgi:hypothetical protein